MSQPTPQESSPVRVAFPLWTKLALVFGGLMSLVIIASAAISFQRELQQGREEQRARLEGLAEVIASQVDGDLFTTFVSSADMERPEFQALVRSLHLAHESMDLDWVGASRQEHGGQFHIVADGGPPPPYPIGYPMFYGVEERKEATRGETLYAPRLEDSWGAWVVAMAPIRDSAGHVVGLVEVQEDALKAEAEARVNAWFLVKLTPLVLLLFVGTAAAFSGYLGRHIRTLTRAALAVARGDLKQRVDLRARDELGVLGWAFDRMVAGLREREFIRETFGRFVSADVASRALSHEGGTLLGGELRQVTVLMSDLRGFSALSLRLGPERMVIMLNRYFSAMTEVIATHRGNLNELLGDGLVVLFGAPVESQGDAERAVACALSMQQALVAFNQAHGLSLEMGIGLATGQVIAGNIGSEQRMKYSVVGAPINLAARLEGYCTGNQVLVCADTRDRLIDLLELGEPVDVRPKGWTDLLRSWPVLSLTGTHAVRMPPEALGELWTNINLTASCQRIENKKIDEEALEVRVTSGSASRLQLHAAWEPQPRSQLQVTLSPGTHWAVEGLCGMVSWVRPEPDGGFLVELRLSGVPDPTALRRLLYQAAD